MSNDGTEDRFGLDREFIARLGRTVFRFLHDFYWRVELGGLENIPCTGPVMLTGLHRGIVPFDAMMILHGMARSGNRIPRFLIHPALLRSQRIGGVVTRLGGVVANREHADWLLERGEVLGMFPEGVQGAFCEYRHAYQLHSFGRHDYVALALKHRAPIVPFVTVGSAEVFPVLKNVRWKRWKALTGWPSLPLTPTFPFLPPVPLPSKWHTLVLEPMHFEQDYPPEAASDRKLVKQLSQQVQDVLLSTMLEIRQRRPGIFWGNALPISDPG